MKNTFVKVLSFLMALTMIVGAFGTVAVFAADECTHEGTTTETVIEPTCKANGYTRYECSACNAHWIGTIVPKSADYHNWKDVLAEGPTCTTGSHGAGKICTICGEKDFTYADDKIPHSFIQTKTELTCTQDAAYVYVCKYCGDSAEKIYGDNVPEDLQKTVITPAKGCVPANYKWEVVSMPKNGTVCTDGLAIGTCPFCGEKAEKVIEVEHKYVAVQANTACALYKSGKICEFCGEEDPDNPLVPNDDPKHTFDIANAIGVGAELTASGVSGWTFADFAKVGIAVGDKISVVPSCVEGGQYVGRCACGEPVKMVVPATGHKYGDFDPAIKYGVPGADGKYTEAGLKDERTLCTDNEVQVQTCVNGTCGAKNYRVVKEGSEHDFEITVTDPTCYANGFTTRDCKVEGCQFDEDPYNYVDKLVHKYDAPYTIELDGYEDVVENEDAEGVTPVTTCKVDEADTRVWVKGCNLCKDEDGDYTYVILAAAADVKDNQKTHKYTKITVAATCSEKSYTIEICDWCKAPKADSKKYVDGSQVNASAHNYTEFKKNPDGEFYTEGFANVNWASDDTKSTCITLGQSVWTCTICDAIKVATSATYGDHTPVTGFNDEAENGVKVNVARVEPTCQADGKTAGAACSVCGEITTEQKPIENDVNDPTQHKNATKVEDKCVAKSTCTVIAHDVYTTTCCGVIEIYAEGATYAAHVYKKDGEDNEVAYKAPKCEEDGNHAYIACVNCGAVKPGSVSGEDCDGKCGIDHALLPVHGNTNAKISKTNTHVWAKKGEAGYTVGSAETCDDEGTYDVTTCKVCHKVKVFSTAEGKIFAADKTAEIKKESTIAAHGDYYVRYVAPKKATCTSDGVLENKATENRWCTKCMNGYDDPDTTDVVEGYKVKKAPHTYVAAENVYINLGEDKNELLDCRLPHGYLETCSVCGHVEEHLHDALNTKADHVWADASKIKPSNPTCTEAGIKVVPCTLCTAVKKIEDKPAIGHYTELNGVKTPIDLSCGKIADYHDVSCADCGLLVDATGKNAGKDGYFAIKHNEIPLKQDATCTKDGFNIVYCADCGVTLVNEDYVEAYTHDYNYLKTLGKVEYVIEETDAYIDFVCKFCGETIREPKVAENAVPVYTASSKKVAAGEEFTVTFAYTAKEQTLKYGSVKVTFDNAKLAFVGVEAADLEGLYVTAGEVGDKINVVYFVANDSKGNEQSVTTTVEGTVLFTLKFVAKSTASGEALVGTEKVTVTALGDLNNDSNITPEDAYAIFNHFEAQTAYADVNRDGIVDVRDIEDLAQFIADGKTVAAYLAMIGESVEGVEDKVFDLLALGRINDRNKDLIANTTDAFALIADVEAYLDEPYTVLGDMTTLDDIIAFVNANPAV